MGGARLPKELNVVTKRFEIRRYLVCEAIGAPSRTLSMACMEGWNHRVMAHIQCRGSARRASASLTK